MENNNTPNLTETEVKTTHCLNCGTDYEGNFCPECGQKAMTKRLSLANILDGVVSVFLTRDNKTVRTCRELITQPGKLVRNFILGRRGRYNAPMPLLVALVALYSVVVHFMPDAASPYQSVKVNITSTTTTTIIEDGVEKTVPQETTKLVSLWDPKILDELDLETVVMLAVQEVMGNIIYHAVACCLLCAVPYYWVFRRRKLQRLDGQELPMNTAEHFFALFYLACVSIMLALFSLPLNFIPGAKDILNGVLVVLPTVIGFYMYRQILGLSWPRSIWLNLLASLLTVALIALFLLLVIYGNEYIAQWFADEGTTFTRDTHFNLQ